MAKYSKRKPTPPGGNYDKAFPCPHNSFVFVYDGLMRDLDEHSVLKDGGAQFMTYAMTKKHHYTLRDFKDVHYSAAVEDGNGRIAGEVYKVDAKLLKSLDAHQHNGKIFERKLIKMNGFRKKCWMYTYVPDVDHSLVDQMFLDKKGRILYDYRAVKENTPILHLVKTDVQIQPSALQIWKECYEVRSFRKDSASRHSSQQVSDKNTVEETIRYTNTNKLNGLAKATKLYNPNIILEDGTMVNKDKLAHDLLALTDWLEKAVRAAPDDNTTEGDKVNDILSTLDDMRFEIKKLAITNTIDYAPREPEIINAVKG